MRLTQQQQFAIVSAVQQVDAGAEIYLHGSRADDNALGGDIDVLLLSDKINLMGKLDILTRLRPVLGERKIDLTVFRDSGKPFAQLALRTGVRLN